MKVCQVCRVSKELEQFHADKRGSQGRSNRCRSCASEYAKVYYSLNKEQIKATSREYRGSNAGNIKRKIKEWLSTEGGKAKTAAVKKKHRQKYPDRHTARKLLRLAVKSGDVVRGEVCETPGCSSAAGLEGHHVDYTRPLQVVWLCKPCHTAVHRRNYE